MSRKRLLAILATVCVAVAGAAAALLPMSASSAAEACAAAYNNSTVYVGGNRVSYQGRNWTAKWWTQDEAPSTGGSGVWADNGVCGSGGGNPPAAAPATTRTGRPARATPAGSIVRYTDGKYYIAEHDNPGYDPIISTWYWDPYTCPAAAAAPPRRRAVADGFVGQRGAVQPDVPEPESRSTRTAA